MPDRLLAELKQTKPFPRPSAEAALNILRTAAPRATVPLEGVEQAMLGRIAVLGAETFRRYICYNS